MLHLHSTARLTACAALACGLSSTAFGQAFVSPPLLDAPSDDGIVEMHAADLDGDGHDDIVYVTESLDIHVAFWTGIDTFAPSFLAQAASFPTPLEIRFADVDGGADELVMLDSASRVTVSRLVDDAFVLISELPLPQNTRAFDIGDLDGDDALDLIVFEAAKVRHLVFEADGLGGWLERPRVPGVPGINAVSLGDVNGDRRTDVVDLVAGLSVDPVVRVSLQQPNGTFGPATTTTSTYPTPISSVEELFVTDLTGDGRDDVVLVGRNDTVVLVTNADGVPVFHQDFDHVALHSLMRAPHPALIDIDDDGSDEVFVGVVMKGGVVSFTTGFIIDWNGAGFSWDTVRATTLVSIDADEDGFSDVVAGYEPLHTSATPVRILHGRGSVFLAETTTGNAGYHQKAIGDIDGDGRDDLLHLSGEAVSVNFARGFGTFGPTTRVIDANTNVIGIADQDGDGHMDIVTNTFDIVPFTIETWLGDGNGEFTKVATPVPAFDVASVVDSGDFDGDGRLDVLVTHDPDGAEPRGVYALTLTPNDDVTVNRIVTASIWPSTPLRVADLDGDHDDDVVIGMSSGGVSEVTVALSQGDGTFVIDELTTTGIPQPDVADFDGDGTLDLFVASTIDSLIVAELSYRPGVGDGTFGAPVTISAADELVDARLVTVDIDGDGRAEVIAAKTYEGYAVDETSPGVFETSDASAHVYAHLPTGALLRTADLDGDGRVEVLAERSVLIPADRRWTRVGNSLAGSADFSTLRAEGTLAPFSDLAFEIPNGPASTTLLLIFGLSQIDVPLFGGTLVPHPDALLVANTDADGRFVVSLPTPPLPPGFEFYAQAWFPAVKAATIAIRGETDG